jgi:hypothetical protein
MALEVVLLPSCEAVGVDVTEWGVVFVDAVVVGAGAAFEAVNVECRMEVPRRFAMVTEPVRTGCLVASRVLDVGE